MRRRQGGEGCLFALDSASASARRTCQHSGVAPVGDIRYLRRCETDHLGAGIVSVDGVEIVEAGAGAEARRRREAAAQRCAALAAALTLAGT